MGLLKLKTFLMALSLLTSLTDANTSPSDEKTNNQLEDKWIVQTSTGPVEGIVENAIDNLDVYVFKGIPYAEPPTGRLRFKPPQPVRPWTDVLRAAKEPLPCYQFLTAAATKFVVNEGGVLRRPWTEDCLTLNIWVPRPVVQQSPVLVVIHPGMFGFGSNAYPDGKVLSVYAHNVIVSMNYRLSAFGFLNLGVPDAPGNVGLLDQQLALKWVHDNVHHFGGKTDAVILVGAGNAGGASAGYHLLSPGSADYFKTIVPFSGAPICQWAFQSQKTSLRKAKAVYELLGCGSNNTDEVLECLQNVHPEDIVDADLSHLEFTNLHFTPTVDGNFITESPLEALESGRFKKATALLITNAHEGSIPLNLMNPNQFIDIEKGISVQEFHKAVKKIYPSLSEAELSIVEDYYIDNCGEEDPEKIRNSAIEVYSDLLFGCCISRFAEYIFEHGSDVYISVNDRRKASKPSWQGSSHLISVQYAFGYPLIDDDYDETQKNNSASFISWINEYSKKKSFEMRDSLQPFKTKEKAYTLWDTEGPHYLTNYRENHCNLWGEIIPKFQKHLKKIKQE